MRGDVLTVIGDLVEDVVVWTSGPLVAGTDNPSKVMRTRGGSAANVAARAARLVPARFIGCIGADEVGTRLVADLRATGVDVRVQRGGRTGTVVVIVHPDGERTMFNDRGAAADLEAVVPAWLRSTAVLHVPAYGLEPVGARQAIIAAAEVVRAAGGVVSIDVSAVTLITSFGVAAFDDLLDRLSPTYVLANGEEAEALGWAERPAPPGRFHIVKRGPDPVRVISSEGPMFEVAAEAVPTVRDTTGAGDAFAGGFLAAIIDGLALDDACRVGHRCAAEVLSTPGA